MTRRRGKRSVTIELDAFAMEALEDEARQIGVSAGELASFGLMYFLADHDSGRTARRLPPAGEAPQPIRAQLGPELAKARAR